ncbi:hypothetical protein NEICINOT_03195 [Neisseria cinerea ATCC 14685]|uniref:Uncharacterized protein n=1 Tax=Neisseria cinerea ATCC 14685 TaxID=546262 RepID=D0W0M9_NEICI|nr:hypothetical protein NEICINOT_03195 [Neisseria cinerea ATCC 14685]
MYQLEREKRKEPSPQPRKIPTYRIFSLPRQNTQLPPFSRKLPIKPSSRNCFLIK